MNRTWFFAFLRIMKIAVAIAAIALISFSPVIATVKDKKMAKPASLYKRLGGKKAIKAVVDDFVNNVAGDSRINKFFANTVRNPKRLAAFKGNLVDQLCQASGGPCKYKGKDMKTAHKGMGITEADFNALVEDLVKALDTNHVSATEKNELLGALGPMKGDTVERGDTVCDLSVCPMQGTCKRKCKKRNCTCPIK